MDGIVAGGANLISYNAISHNGGNGIVDEGANIVTLNTGEGNHVFGILIGGNPVSVQLNSVSGIICDEFPPNLMSL